MINLKPFQKKLLIAAMVLTPIIGAAFPVLADDGTANLTGARQDAAKYVLNSYDAAESGGGSIPGLAKLRVGSVTYTPGDDPACQNNDNYYAYTVTLERRWWFGIATPVKTTNICSEFGGE